MLLGPPSSLFQRLDVVWLLEGFCKTMPDGGLGPGGTSGVRVRLGFLRRRRNEGGKVYISVCICV